MKKEVKERINIASIEAKITNHQSIHMSIHISFSTLFLRN